MGRRDSLLWCSRSSVAVPRVAAAGDAVVGVLRADTPAAGANVVAAFRKGLSEMGFVEGRNVTLELRWAQNDRARMPELAAESGPPQGRCHWPRGKRGGCARGQSVDHNNSHRICNGSDQSNLG